MRHRERGATGSLLSTSRRLRFSETPAGGPARRCSEPHAGSGIKRPEVLVMQRDKDGRSGFSRLTIFVVEMSPRSIERAHR